MAYILGFFAADGEMFINSEGSRYLQFTSTDYEILEKIRNLLLAKQKISLKKKSSKDHKDCYLFQ
ncbi:MAG: LAGLIDADG family homing endonuclease, partial [Candidatus Omnitrophica bacterium]|nr:LAGLIDADG family homing endonuclease [Candidatus Omnitrophota bacterium]